MASRVYRSCANPTSNTGIIPNPASAEVTTRTVDIVVVHLIMNSIEYNDLLPDYGLFRVKYSHIYAQHKRESGKHYTSRSAPQNEASDLGLHCIRFVCLFDLDLTSLSTIFQSYRDGVWMWQGAECSLLECCLTEISCTRHFDMIFHPETLY